MKYLIKSVYILISCILLIATLDSCRSKTPWNPYLSAKEKPSEKQRKEEQAQLKKGTKAYNKQVKKNKSDIQNNINRATSMKKRHRKVTKVKRRNKSKKQNWRL